MKRPNPNQFYRITLDQAISFYWYGMINVSGLLFFAVNIYRKQGQTLRIENIPAFCEMLGISQRAFYKAKAALVNTGFLEEEIYGAVGLKSVPLYDEQSCSQDEQSCSQDEQSCSQDEQSCSQDEQSCIATIDKPPEDKHSSDSSDIYSDIYSDIFQNSLSDPEEEKTPLTNESTAVVQSDLERENFSIKKAEQGDLGGCPHEPLLQEEEKEQEEVKPKLENKQELNHPAYSLKNDSPRSAPTNQSEVKKGFGARSTKKVLNTTKSTNELRQKYDNRGFPRLIEKLYEEGLEESKHNEFIDYVIKRFKEMPKYPSYPDALAIKRFGEFMNDFLDYCEKKNYVEKCRASYLVAEEDEPKPVEVEVIDPNKPQKSMKQIAAEIRRARDEKLRLEAEKSKGEQNNG